MKLNSDEKILIIKDFIKNNIKRTSGNLVNLTNYRKLMNFFSNNTLNLSENEAKIILTVCPIIEDTISNVFDEIDEIEVSKIKDLSTILDVYNKKNLKNLNLDDISNVVFRDSDDLDIYKMYLREIGEYKLLSKKEIQELADKSINGNMDARNKLVRHNLRLVVYIAKRYYKRNDSIPLVDLIQYGNEGLIRACEKYDTSIGSKFSTYATWWIKQGIQRGTDYHELTIKMPEHKCQMIRKINRTEKSYKDDHNGEAPSMEELSYMTGISEEVIKTLKNIKGTVSLSTPVGDEDSTLEDIIPGDNEDLSDEVFYKEFINAFNNIEELSERDKSVIRYRFGIEDGFIYTLDQVGKMYGLTREGVRQIEIKALNIARSRLRMYSPKNDGVIPKTYLLKKELSNKGK